MKKGLGLIITLCLFLLTGCSESGSTLEQFKQKDVITIGISADYPPYEYYIMNGGKEELAGFDIMLANEIAKELGIKIQFKDMKFDSLVAALQAGQVDMVISGMTPDAERMEAVDFTDLYYTGIQTVLVKKELSETLTTADMLKDYKLGAQLGSVQAPIAKGYTSNVKELAKTQDLVLELQNGNIDALVIGAEIAERYAKEYEGLAVAKFTLDAEEGMAVALPKGSDEIVKEINKIINELKSSGKIAQMLEEAIEISNNQ